MAHTERTTENQAPADKPYRQIWCPGKRVSTCVHDGETTLLTHLALVTNWLC